MTSSELEQSITEIYIATFGRSPDKAGLDYWVGEYNNGNITLEDMNKNFYYEQDESRTLYENMSDDEFIDTIYTNVLGRQADVEGKDYWLTELESGNLSKDVFIKALIDGAKAKTGNADDALLLENKVTTALYYTNNVQVDSPLASELVLNVTSDTQSVNDAIGTVEYYDNWITEYLNASNNSLNSDDLWTQINNDAYWQNLSSTVTVNTNGTSFWEYDDDLWEHGSSGRDFDFIENSAIWSNQDTYNQLIDGTLYEDYLNNLDVTLANLQNDLATGQTVDITELQAINQSFDQVEDYYEYNYGIDIEDYYEYNYGVEPDDILEDLYGYVDDYYENDHDDDDDYYDQYEDYFEYTYGFDVDIENAAQLQYYQDLIQG